MIDNDGFCDSEMMSDDTAWALAIQLEARYEHSFGRARYLDTRPVIKHPNYATSTHISHSKALVIDWPTKPPRPPSNVFERSRH